MSASSLHRESTDSLILNLALEGGRTAHQVFQLEHSNFYLHVLGCSIHEQLCLALVELCA